MCEREAQRSGTYRDHGQEDKASGSSLPSAIVGIDQAIDRRGRQNKAATEVSDNRDMIGLGAIGRNDNEDADDGKEVEDYRPPRKQRKVRPCLKVGEDRAEEGDDPCQLSSATVSIIIEVWGDNG